VSYWCLMSSTVCVARHGSPLRYRVTGGSWAVLARQGYIHDGRNRRAGRQAGRLAGRLWSARIMEYQCGHGIQEREGPSRAVNH